MFVMVAKRTNKSRQAKTKCLSKTMFARLAWAFHKVTITKRNFHPSGLFDNWGTGARRLLTVEREEASIFQAADFATTVADMFVELYCYSKTNYFL